MAVVLMLVALGRWLVVGFRVGLRAISRLWGPQGEKARGRLGFWAQRACRVPRDPSGSHPGLVGETERCGRAGAARDKRCAPPRIERGCNGPAM
jgi:hypothetical protein